MPWEGHRIENDPHSLKEEVGRSYQRFSVCQVFLCLHQNTSVATWWMWVECTSCTGKQKAASIGRVRENPMLCLLLIEPKCTYIWWPPSPGRKELGSKAVRTQWMAERHWQVNWLVRCGKSSLGNCQTSHLMDSSTYTVWIWDVLQSLTLNTWPHLVTLVWGILGSFCRHEVDPDAKS